MDFFVIFDMNLRHTSQVTTPYLRGWATSLLLTDVEHTEQVLLAADPKKHNQFRYHSWDVLGMSYSPAAGLGFGLELEEARVPNEVMANELAGV